MGLINEVIYYINMVGVCLIIAFMIAGGILLYFLKVKKIAARVENINTMYFKKEDTMSYVPIQDMLYKDNINSDGIIAVTDTIFVGGISVQGFDYGTASLDERIDTEASAVAFMGIIEDVVSFRQSVKATDLSVNIDEYEQITKKLALELMELDAEYQSTLAMGEDYIDEPDTYQYYADRLKELQRVISAKNHMLDECKELIGYMGVQEKDMTNSTAGQKTSHIMFSYVFNPDLYSTTFSKEEIYLKAQEALDAKAKSYIDALAYCHFPAKRLSCKELFELIKKHNSPLTGEDASLDELLHSSDMSLFISCDSLVEAQKEKIGQEEYEAMLADYQKQIDEMIKQQRLNMARESKILLEKSNEQALQEIEGIEQ